MLSEQTYGDDAEKMANMKLRKLGYDDPDKFLDLKKDYTKQKEDLKMLFDE